MAGYMNRATIIGNLGADPEIRTTRGGDRVASFTVATTESWNDKRSGERQERTEWHRIVVWNEGLVGVLEKYVTKGDKVMVEGMLKTQKWVDQSGNERYTTEIHLKPYQGTLIMLSPPKGASRDDRIPAPSGRRPAGASAGAGGGAGVNSDLDDEIPF